MRSESTHHAPKRHYSVTPTLFVGPSPTPRAVRVETSAEAVRIIRSGQIAVLPEGAWSEAEMALEQIAGRQHAQQRVAITKAGRLV